MKKIITGKRYDTEKATEIGYYSNVGREASSPSDFRAWSATLYKTPRSGVYFLAGHGGGDTKFARTVSGGMRTDGEKIFPMTTDEAFRWAQEYLDEEIVEKEFGDMIEDA